MNLKKVLLPVILFISIATKANNPSDALLLNSGTIYPQGNINEFISEEISANEIVDGYYFRIIQFSDFPDEKIKKEINASGIILNTYLPYRAYNCAIPVGFDRRKLIQLNAHSVLSWNNNFKTDKVLTNADFPKHTVLEEGKVDVVIRYQNNILPERAKQLLSLNNYAIVGATDATHSVTLRVPFQRFNEVVELPFVYFVEAIPVPSTKDDTEGRSLHRSNTINADYSSGRHYDGSGVVVGLADDGAIGPHIDFTGRLTQHVTGLGGNHGDMTSGICAGAGNLISRIRGMGTGAYLHVFDISGYPQIVNAVSNYNNYGIVITSTSYAQTCNDYNTDSELGDQLIHQNKQFSFCFSAGNEGTTDCQYGAGNLWGNITGGYKLGKNVIAVGNLDATDILENSSSRGPAIDGRIKPEICSNGIDQRSTDEYNTYQVGGGTSAACPGVAGTLSQLYQAYKSLTGQPNPPSGLIKACILNSAEDLGNPGPDFKHGWGRINAFRALTTLEDNRFLSDSVGQGQTKTHNITVPSGVKQLRVMLYWHDKEGSAAAAKALVNDLNLQVEDPSPAVFNPWVLDPTPNTTALNSLPVRGIDSLNNAEQVTIDNPVAGNYSITVNGFQIPLNHQEYFIVYEFRSDSIHVTFPIGGEGFVPSGAELIRWDAFDTAGTFDLRYSINNGSTWNNIITGLPGSERYYTWNVPNVVSDQVLIEVSRNGISDVNDSFFTIINMPSNFRVVFACPDSIGLAWNPISNASGYDVHMLGAKYMDVVGTTTDTSFIIAGTNPLTEYWFSVKALGPNGGKGPRGNAISHSGLINCILNLDGGITDVISPPSGSLMSCMNLTNVPVTIEILNSGLTPITNFSLNYSLNGGTVTTEQFTDTIAPSSSMNFNFSQSLTIPGIGSYVLKIWITLSGDQNFYNDSINHSMTVVSGTTASLPLIEIFDSMAGCNTTNDCDLTNCPLTNGWFNAENGINDDIDWRVNNGSTPTNNSGPDTDHTTGGGAGKYIYLEASTCATNEAVLLSPCIDLTSGIANPMLYFWYHMFGSAMGELHVDIIGETLTVNDILPAKTGNLGNFWLKDSVSLSQFNGQKINIRFRGITGNGNQSDLALDDIGILDISTSINEFTSLTPQFIVYPNPGTGIYQFITGKLNGNNSSILVYDALGKVVFRKELTENIANHSGTIDLTGFSKGVYTATLETDGYSKNIRLILVD
jgi:hypothetical protein